MSVPIIIRACIVERILIGEIRGESEAKNENRMSRKMSKIRMAILMEFNIKIDFQ